MSKHLILIHGRATKPTRAEKIKLVNQALISGLERVDGAAAKAVASGKIKTSFAYYGDLSNQLMVAAKPEYKKGMICQDGVWYEKDGSYDEDLATLQARPTEKITAAEYRELLKRVKDLRAVDDFARILSPLVGLFGLSEQVIKKVLPDMGAYLTSRVVGSKIRQRLQVPLLEALRNDDDVCLVAHSMGCIVSYDVLWKFSRMSEYAEVQQKPVSLWMTLGNPLGEPAVKAGLYDADEPEDGRYPTNINHWLNISAYDDFVAHDGDVADDFKDMAKLKVNGRKAVGKIEDLDRIYNFWAGRDGSNPHKFYGYLNHPVVAGRLAKWITG